MKKFINFITLIFASFLFASIVFAGYSDFDQIRLASDGSVSEPSITWLDDDNIGFYRVGADQIGVIIGGSSVGTFSASGYGGSLGTITSAGTFSGANTFSGNNTFTGDNTFSSSTSAKPLTIFKNTSADATAIEIRVIKDSGSPGNGDDVIKITGYSDNSSASAVEVFEMLVEVDDVTTGSVDSTVKFSLRQADTKINILDIGSTAVVINEDSKDVDFRVESDGNANMLFVDGGDNAVGIGKDPTAGTELDVNGDIAASGEMTCATLNFTVIDFGAAGAAAEAYVTANSTHRVTANINGTNYWILLHQVE